MRGSQCKIYSQSKQKWYDGQIIKVLPNERVKVQYRGSIEREIHIDSPYIKISETNNDYNIPPDRNKRRRNIYYSEGMHVEVYSHKYSKWIHGIIKNINHSSHSVDIHLDSNQDPQRIGTLHIKGSEEQSRIRPKQIDKSPTKSILKTSNSKSRNDSTLQFIKRIDKFKRHKHKHSNRRKSAVNETDFIDDIPSKSKSKNNFEKWLEENRKFHDNKPGLLRQKEANDNKFHYEWSKSSKSKKSSQNRQKWKPMHGQQSHPKTAPAQKRTSSMNNKRASAITNRGSLIGMWPWKKQPISQKVVVKSRMKPWMIALIIICVLAVIGGAIVGIIMFRCKSKKEKEEPTKAPIEIDIPSTTKPEKKGSDKKVTSSEETPGEEEEEEEEEDVSEEKDKLAKDKAKMDNEKTKGKVTPSPSKKKIATPTPIKEKINTPSPIKKVITTPPSAIKKEEPKPKPDFDMDELMKDANPAMKELYEKTVNTHDKDYADHNEALFKTLKKMKADQDKGKIEDMREKIKKEKQKSESKDNPKGITLDIDIGAKDASADAPAPDKDDKETPADDEAPGKDEAPQSNEEGPPVDNKAAPADEPKPIQPDGSEVPQPGGQGPPPGAKEAPPGEKGPPAGKAPNAQEPPPGKEGPPQPNAEGPPPGKEAPPQPAGKEPNGKEAPPQPEGPPPGAKGPPAGKAPPSEKEEPSGKEPPGKAAAKTAPEVATPPQRRLFYVPIESSTAHSSAISSIIFSFFIVLITVCMQCIYLYFVRR